MSDRKTEAVERDHAPAPPTVDMAGAEPERDSTRQPIARAAATLATPEAGAPQRAHASADLQQSIGNTRMGELAEEQANAPGNGMIVQRQSQSAALPQVGTRFSHPTGGRSLYRRLTATFDGRTFVLFGDGAALMRVAAASGRPVSVRPADARRCKGATSESYLNNPRYLGISDYGPIPEGEFQFRAEEFATFSLTEQAQFTPGGHFTDPFGKPMHGGDWGAGRSPLNKLRVLPALPGCGNTARRSGFYIHGGSLSGSSGCIDIGNAGVASLLPHMTGYRGQIVVSVRYRHPAPEVGTVGRTMGGFVYPGQENPTLGDRLRGAARELLGSDEE